MKINNTTKSVAANYASSDTLRRKTSKASQIYESWAPAIKRMTGLTDTNKIQWIAEMAHNAVTGNHLNEEAGQLLGNSWSPTSDFGGAFSPYNTLYNTVGVGNPIPGSRAAVTGADYANPAVQGSGDKFPAILPLQIKTAAQTIGFDLVNVIPLAGPSGVIPYMDYVYSGSKQPYGATPAVDPATANPAYLNQASAQYTAFNAYGLPHAFKANIVASANSTVLATKEQLKAVLAPGVQMSVGGDASTPATLVVEFIGWSRIDGAMMLKVVSGTQSLGQTFATETGEVAFTVAVAEGAQAQTVTLAGPKLISMLEDQIQGFTGAGEFDNDPWTGTYNDGTVLYDPMTRGTGELTPARQISLQLFTKNIAVGTIQVGVAVTQEQVTDLQKQWGIDVVKTVETAGVNELTATINRHITSRLFGLGWKNHVSLVSADGDAANLNLTFSNAAGQTTPKFALPVGQTTTEGYTSYTQQELPIKPFSPIAGATMENRETLIQRIYATILEASNWIYQRGRRGAATFVVTNVKIASLLQSNAHYMSAAIENTIAQSSNNLYPIGTIGGMTVYVDPNMAPSDTRVLVGRKGAKDEPGLFYCPYVMADVVRIIAEGTGAPKLYIKSRYALVEVGHYPELQYLTFFVNTSALV